MEEQRIKEHGIYMWLKKWKDERGDKCAICDNESSYTYLQLWENVQKLSYEFYRRGIRKGSKVILQLDNCCEFVITLFALMNMGAIPILAVPGLRLNDLDIIAKKIKPVAYIHPTYFMGFSYVELGKTLQSKNQSIKYVWEKANIKEMIMASKMLENEFLTIKRGDIGLILLSSGTTNIPKLIPITQKSFIYHSLCAGQRCLLSEETVYMAVMPVEHKLTFFSPGIMGTLFCGGKVVMCQDSSCENAFSMIEKEKVTMTALVPSMAKIWAEDLRWDDDYDLSSLRFCVIGGAKLCEGDVHDVMETLKCEIIQAYGMSEGFLSLSKPTDSYEERVVYQGQPISKYDKVKILDESGNVLPEDIEGELVVKSPYLFNGYYEMDSDQYFTEDGYYKTGDLGYITCDGHIKITGRKSEQINRMGEKIMPSEIEAYLLENKDIKEAVVLGIPDTLLGERSCAFVKSSKKNIADKEIKKSLEDKKIASYKIPDQIFIVDDFPYTVTGKIDKKALTFNIL